MQKIQTIEIRAFGYGHTFPNVVGAEDIERISSAPYLYLVLGDETMVDSFGTQLPEDFELYFSEVGEGIVFAYEEIPLDTECLADELGLTLEFEDQSGYEVAA